MVHTTLRGALSNELSRLELDHVVFTWLGFGLSGSLSCRAYARQRPSPGPPVQAALLLNNFRDTRIVNHYHAIGDILTWDETSGLLDTYERLGNTVIRVGPAPMNATQMTNSYFVKPTISM